MVKLSVLIIGSGGREHALAWKISQSKMVGKIFCAPGNAGTASVAENIAIETTDIKKLLAFAKEKKIGLTIVGPEDPLALGIVDLFEKNHLAVFGPTKKAARLESSKTWAAGFMKKYRIPQPVSYCFKKPQEACSFIKKSKDISKYVIKASGLAMGKGVILPQTLEEALETIKKIMIDKEFGAAGKEVIIQEKLTGPEVSVMAISDGRTIIPLLPAQDHKRIFDDDHGPNTGGMGAYAPVPFVTKKLIKQIQETILQPTINGMRKENCPFRGILYAGLMITKDGPKVLEYNVRFGDPEVQPLMMLLKSDLLPILLSSIKEKLNKTKIIFHKGASICVVLASEGYPGKYDKGIKISGLDKIYNSDISIFQAGVTLKNNQAVTNGGRVLGVTAVGKDIKKAIKKAYSIIGKKGIYFRGMHYRKDIGKHHTL